MSQSKGSGRRIIEAVKAQIRTGTYRSGDRLPSTRALATDWGVSRTTVTAAYDQLIAEGYLETRRGAPTTVAAGAGSVDGSPQILDSGDVVLSAFGRRLLAAPAPFRPPAAASIEFRNGELAGTDFPTLAWRRALARVAIRRPDRLRYDDAQGSAALRAEIQGYVWRARGIWCEADRIIIVNGSQQGIDLCARLLLDPGDPCVIENPAYPLARITFSAAGARLEPVAVDREGMQTDALPNARLAYVTPSHQFPLGHVLSASRRSALLSWAQRSDAFIVEDDYDGEYRYDIAPIPPLQTLGPDRVIYVGTVSKTLAPTLRLGYLVVPEALRLPFVEAKRLADRHAPSLVQAALADLLGSGTYERHVRSIRRRNRDRRTALVEALNGCLGKRVTVTGADAGLHLVCWIPEVPSSAEGDLLRRAWTAGLGIHPVAPLYDPGLDSPPHVGLLLGYAALSTDEIRDGVRTLARILDDRLKTL